MSEAEFSGDVDMFGDPIIYRDAKKGRPAHERTARNANKVSLLFAMGYQVAEVAAALGITQPTLRKHYFSEVQQRDAMRLKLEAEQLVELRDQAQAGKVAAMKELLARIDKAGMLAVARSVKKRKAPEAEKQAPRGKKEQQKIDAGAVGGIFATRPPPSQVN